MAVVGGVAFSLIHYGTSSWRFRIESSDNIETSGMKNVSRAQVLDVLGADIGRNVFRIPLEDRKKQLEEIPWVRSATVMRLLPDKLRVHITERSPVAFARVGSKVHLIDAGGVVMEMPRGQSKYSFPVITGMTDSEPLSTRAARMKIYATLVKDLDSGGGNYSKDLSEVELSDPEDVKITVEDPAGALVVHLGSSNYLDRYKIYIRHIQEWRQQFNKLESVDLRFNGQIIVNADGRTSGGAAPTASKPR
jgi:cell division protein FtsQ